MVTQVEHTSPGAAYAAVQGLQLVDALRAQGKRFFTTEDARRAADALTIPPATLSWLLTQLTRAGRLVHLRRGLHAIDDSRFGGAAPHPFAIATALVTPSAISHWSALAHHGLTEQIPQLVTASTTRDVVTPRMRRRASDGEPASTWDVPGLRVRYVRVQPRHFWGFEQVWVDETARVAITDRERTVLDGFVAPEVFGSVHEVLGVLEEHLAELDVEKLVGYALRYGRGAVVKRLGYALGQLGVAPPLLAPLREAPIAGYRPLDPAGPDGGRFVAAWRIRDNVGPA
jgi:predicted transcriptional regulator of viral defense system